MVGLRKPQSPKFDKKAAMAGLRRTPGCCPAPFDSPEDGGRDA